MTQLLGPVSEIFHMLGYYGPYIGGRGGGGWGLSLFSLLLSYYKDVCNRFT